MKAGYLVMALLRKLYIGLKLRVSEAERALDGIFGRKFPGCALWRSPLGAQRRRPAEDRVEPRALLPAGGQLSRARTLEPPGADQHAGWYGGGTFYAIGALC